MCQTPHEKEKDNFTGPWKRKGHFSGLHHKPVDNWQLHWKWAPFFFFVGIKRKMGNARALKNAASAIVGSKEKCEASALPDFF